MFTRGISRKMSSRDMDSRPRITIRLKLKNGFLYKGLFKNGVQHGKGEIILPEDPGNVVKGEWAHGEMIEN